MDKKFASPKHCDNIHLVNENAAKGTVECSSTLRKYVKNRPILKRLFSFAQKLMNNKHLKHLGGAAILLPVFLFWTGMMPHNIIRAQDANIVSVYADGEKQVFATEADTVKDALQRINISVGENDLVEPGLTTPINSSSFNINVYRSRPVLVNVDGEEIIVETAYQSPRLIAKAAGLEVYPEDIVELERIDDIASSPLVGTRVKLIHAKKAIVTVDGLSLEVRSHAETVEEVLREKGVELGEKDIVRPGKERKFTDGLSVEVIRVGNEVVTKQESIPFKTRTIEDNNLPLGTVKTREPGKAGKRVVTYKLTLHNEKVVERTQVSAEVIEQPADRVIVKGRHYTGTLSDWLYTLRMCESGGNYSTNTGNGFYGAYQFMISTWDRIAGKVGRGDLIGVRPDLATPADQDYMIVQNTRLSAGGLSSQNPGCYQKGNLSNFPPSS